MRGKRAFTTDTALRLSKALGVDDRFWINIQTDYDLESARPPRCRTRPSDPPCWRGERRPRAAPARPQTTSERRFRRSRRVRHHYSTSEAVVGRK
ncbi:MULTISPECIES: hypothetical protein [unclassified Nocardioides]|uniref:helix-turn-helix transcriptional regulator n=1 Tax=unclassified Nocardioides TaxID=2615069 RepID=UPI0000571678|nr:MULTISPECIES: hypothetical protein [unclassified Nocardioides]ABL81108.1 hypothetical protein Noca_1594 [Nocardioides sp. JS614]